MVVASVANQLVGGQLCPPATDGGAWLLPVCGVGDVPDGPRSDVNEDLRERIEGGSELVTRSVNVESRGEPVQVVGFLQRRGQWGALGHEVGQGVELHLVAYLPAISP